MQTERIRRPARGAHGTLGRAVEDALNRIGVESGEFFVLGDGVATSETRARRADPDTSHQAAESVEDLRVSQLAVLKVFQTHGWLTDEEMRRKYTQLQRVAPADFPRQSDSGLRTRRAELVEAGFLRDSEERRTMTTGRKAIVWTLTPKSGVHDQEELFAA